MFLKRHYMWHICYKNWHLQFKFYTKYNKLRYCTTSSKYKIYSAPCASELTHTLGHNRLNTDTFATQSPLEVVYTANNILLILLIFTTL